MPEMMSVSVGLWVGVGTRYEPAELNGVCHFIEHLLFKGTRKRSAKKISEAVEGIGGYFKAVTSGETSCVHPRGSHHCFDEELNLVVDVFVDMGVYPIG